MKRTMLILILLFAIKSYAQDSTTKNTKLIYKKGFRWRMNGEKLSYRELKTELYKVPATIPVLKKVKTSQTIGGISSIASAGCFLLINSGKKPTNKKNNGWKYATIGLYANALYFYLRSLNFIKKAVRIRNDNIKTVY